MEKRSLKQADRRQRFLLKVSVYGTRYRAKEKSNPACRYLVVALGIFHVLNSITFVIVFYLYTPSTNKGGASQSFSR